MIFRYLTSTQFTDESADNESVAGSSISGTDSSDDSDGDNDDCGEGGVLVDHPQTVRDTEALMYHV